MQAVIFDVGGVLVTSPVRIIRDYENELCIPRYTLGASFSRGAPDNAFCRLERGEILLSQFCVEFQQECLINASQQGVSLPSEFSIKELFHRITTQIMPIQEMIYALRQLKSSGIKTCIITNNWIDDMHSTQTVFPFQEYCDVLLESSREGIRKPDTRIYQIACSKLGVNPSEVVFLDDLGVNLKSAKSLGITTLLVKDTLSTIKELEQIMNMTLTNSKL